MVDNINLLNSVFDIDVTKSDIPQDLFDAEWFRAI